MNFNLKLGSAVAIASFVATVVAPAGLADTTVDVTNNGAKSDNTVVVNNTTGGTAVSQSNHSAVINTVSVNQVTGKNNASGNTGGNTTVTTGEAGSGITLNVGGSTNDALVAPACGCASDTNVTVSDNGRKSNNTVVINNGVQGNKKAKGQTNGSFIVNSINVKQVTGKNKAKNNTDGTTNVTTGKAGSGVTVNVTGSSNVYTVTP